LLALQDRFRLSVTILPRNCIVCRFTHRHHKFSSIPVNYLDLSEFDKNYYKLFKTKLSSDGFRTPSQTLTSQETSIVVSSALVGKTKPSNENSTAVVSDCVSWNAKLVPSTGHVFRMTRLSEISLSSTVHLPTENSSESAKALVGAILPKSGFPGWKAPFVRSA